MKTNRKCKKNEKHYIDDWGCVDCMFEALAKKGWKEVEADEKKWK